MAKFTRDKVTGCLKSSALTLATLAGVIGGVIFGLVLKQREGKERDTYLRVRTCVMMRFFPINFSSLRHV